MTNSYKFYPGVHQNIAAAIGTTMIMISLYMIIQKPWPLKIIYCLALVIHLDATLLTSSRGNFIALLIALSGVGGMACWHMTRNRAAILRIILSSAAVIIVAGIIWWLRTGVFTIFENITHLSKLLGQTSSTASSVESTAPASAQRSLTLDAPRARIWRSSIHIMFSSPRYFFFGVPIGRITTEIQSMINSLYGTNELYAHAHNMILQTGLVTGVPGMGMFIAFLIMMFIRCIRVGLRANINKHFQGAYVFPIAILAMIIVNLFEPFLIFYISVILA